MLALSLEARWEVGRQVYGDENFLELGLCTSPMALQLGGWDTKKQERSAELEPEHNDHSKEWGGAEEGGRK